MMMNYAVCSIFHRGIAMSRTIFQKQRKWVVAKGTWNRMPRLCNCWSAPVSIPRSSEPEHPDRLCTPFTPGTHTLSYLVPR